MELKGDSIYMAVEERVLNIRKGNRPLGSTLPVLDELATWLGRLGSEVAELNQTNVSDVFEQIQHRISQCDTTTPELLRECFSRLCAAAASNSTTNCLERFLPLIPLDRSLQHVLFKSCFVRRPSLARDFLSLAIKDPDTRYQAALACMEISPRVFAKYASNFDLPPNTDRTELIATGLLATPDGTYKHFPEEVASLMGDAHSFRRILRAALEDHPTSLWDLLQLRSELMGGSNLTSQESILGACKSLCREFYSSDPDLRYLNLIQQIAEAGVPPTASVALFTRNLSREELSVVLPSIANQSIPFSEAQLQLVAETRSAVPLTSEYLSGLRRFMTLAPWHLHPSTFKAYQSYRAQTGGSASNFFFSLRRASLDLVLAGPGDHPVRNSQFFEAIVNSVFRTKSARWAYVEDLAVCAPQRNLFTSLERVQIGGKIDLICSSRIKPGARSHLLLLESVSPLDAILKTDELSRLAMACKQADRCVPPGVIQGFLQCAGLAHGTVEDLLTATPTLGKQIALASLLKISSLYAAPSISDCADVKPENSRRARPPQDAITLLSHAQKDIRGILKRSAVQWQAVYSLPHASSEAYLARDAMGLCSGGDQVSWENPNYHQILHFDLESASIIGVTQLHAFEHEKGMRGVLIRPNPSDFLGRVYDSRDVAAAVLRPAIQFLSNENVDLFLPEQTESHLLTNREWLVPALEAFSGRPIHHPIVLTEKLTSSTARAFDVETFWSDQRY